MGLQVLPTWSQKTLTAHKGDKRDCKTIQQLEEGNTGDEIWDALQFQLNQTGVVKEAFRDLGFLCSQINKRIINLI